SPRQPRGGAGEALKQVNGGGPGDVASCSAGPALEALARIPSGTSVDFGFFACFGALLWTELGPVHRVPVRLRKRFQPPATSPGSTKLAYYDFPRTIFSLSEDTRTDSACLPEAPECRLELRIPAMLIRYTESSVASPSIVEKASNPHVSHLNGD